MILHISNDFSGSTVYKHLIGELDNLGLNQIVYTPVRHEDLIGKNKITLSQPNSKILYRFILHKYIDRLFYRKKIKKIVRDLEIQIDLRSVKLIHAHTWYSDGGVAYLLSRKYNIPYLVTVRNSDLNVFYKYLIHERIFGKKILHRASAVVVISAAYKTRLLSRHKSQTSTEPVVSKLSIIPNGVDPYWIAQSQMKKKVSTAKAEFSVLFIGKFSKGKNILNLLQAIVRLNRDKKYKVHLDIVGGGGGHHREVIRRVRSYPDLMTYHGKVFEKERLKKYFRQADIFAMPSKNETFGLVYVEALLQGLPILYTQNEGIDGYYNENIGEKVSMGTVAEITEKIMEMIRNYNSYTIPVDKVRQNHNWKNIAREYEVLYQTI